MQWDGDDEIDIFEGMIISQGCSVPFANAGSELGGITIFQGMKEMLHRTFFYKIAEGGGMNQGDTPSKQLCDGVLFEAMKMGKR